MSETLQVPPLISGTTEPQFISSLTAKGAIRVFLTRNIGHRAFRDDPTDTQYPTFQRVRGTPAFADAVRNLEKTITRGRAYILDEETQRAQRTGYEMGVFSQYPLYYDFMPFYELKDSFVPEIVLNQRAKDALEALNRQGLGLTEASLVAQHNARLKDEWDKWPCKKIMLSRYGVYQIVFEQHVEKPTPLASILENIIGLDQKLDITDLLKPRIDEIVQAIERKNIDGVQQATDLVRGILENKATLESSLDYSLQWEAVRALISHFIDSFKGELKIKTDTLEPIILKLNEQPLETLPVGIPYNLRFRYVIFELQELQYDNIPITHEHHGKGVHQQLSSLLESVLLTDRPSEKRELAPIKSDITDRLFEEDVATWKGEHCLISTDNAVICHHPPGSRLLLSFSHPNNVEYKHYWESIIRGLGYISELRLIAKLVESDTSDELEGTTHYMSGATLNNPQSIRTAMEALATKISTYSRLVARLRNATMPTTMATADYAISKYHRLSKVLELDMIIEHASRNIELINSFLAHYDDMVLQSDNFELQKDTVHLQLDVKVASLITLGLTIVIAFLTVTLAWLTLPIYINELTSPDTEAAQIINNLFGAPFDTLSSTWARRIGAVFTVFVTLVSCIVVFIGVRSIFHLLQRRKESMEALNERITDVLGASPPSDANPH